jgi:hypothetical protein
MFQRRGTKQQWETINPVLAVGEIGFSFNENVIKLGDGLTAWNSLPSVNGNSAYQVARANGFVGTEADWLESLVGPQGGPGKFTVQALAPGSPEENEVWFNSSVGRSYIYYDGFWVDLSPGVQGPAGPGIATGGQPGQILSKSGTADYETTWIDGRTSENYIINGAFDIWQRGTTFTVSGIGSGANVPYTTDRWQVWASTSQSNVRVTRQASTLAQFRYAARIQRVSGNTSTEPIAFSTVLESSDSMPLAGKQVTLSFYARAGANFSSTASTIGAIVWSGTGIDASPTLWPGPDIVASGSPELTTSWQRFEVTGTVSSLATQIFVRFGWGVSGTAGANDWVEITGVQLEAGSKATSFRRNSDSLEGEMAACQRYYISYNNERSNGSINQNIIFSPIGVATSNRVAKFVFPFPVRMRREPLSIEYDYETTGKYFTPLDIQSQTMFITNISVASLQSEYSSPDFGAMQYDLGAGGNLTVGRPVVLKGSGFSDVRIQLAFSAEL